MSEKRSENEPDLESAFAVGAGMGAVNKVMDEFLGFGKKSEGLKLDRFTTFLEAHVDNLENGNIVDRFYSRIGFWVFAPVFLFIDLRKEVNA